MVEGLHFLSMEYIDGEDLASLLRRIGRLPQDKAIEFTRKICAGLSAAHERGVLHRDLKPANIMIDARGQVRITDFGLAALAQEIPLSDLRSGTPAYMSPEQKAGKEVTTRSDIYSLGLVLHEMFTGKARKDTQSSPSELVKDLDPAIERLILRCLEDEPRRRPQTPLNVAMALPGADPIAAALAAGETPSPEMVAASEEKEGFSIPTAVLCFLGIVVSVIAGFTLAGKTTFLGRARLDIPPDALAYRAQEILKQFGYTEQTNNVAYGFDLKQTSLRFLERYPPSQREGILASHRPAVIRFWYREHSADLGADPVNGRISYDSPPNTQPGMIRMALDAKGRLIALEARPAGLGTGASAEPEWSTLFTAAEFDPARFKAVPPQQVPPMAFDAHMAWSGPYADKRPDQVRVEAAWWQGHPVYIDIQDESRQEESTSSLSPYGIVVLLIAAVAAVFIARHNLKFGRADRRGAAVIAVAGILSGLGYWIFSAHHTLSSAELSLLFVALGLYGLYSSLLWVSYIATEPYVRRHWPDALISWTRIRNGRLRDPLVASHVLAGIVSMEVFLQIYQPAAQSLFSAQKPLPRSIDSLNNTARAVANLLSDSGGLAETMLILILVVLARILVRRVWMADLLASILLGLQGALSFGDSIFQLIGGMAFWGSGIYLFLWMLRRLGFLAYLASSLTLGFVSTVPLSMTSWYAGRALFAQMIPVSIAIWALWVIVSAQRRPAADTA
jgi:serine/threonine-protein kinase